MTSVKRKNRLKKRMQEKKVPSLNEYEKRKWSICNKELNSVKTSEVD